MYNLVAYMFIDPGYGVLSVKYYTEEGIYDAISKNDFISYLIIGGEDHVDTHEILADDA